MPKRAAASPGPSLTRARFRELRLSLGLTQPELARVLGYADRMNVALMENPSPSGRDVPPAIARLMQAYAAGYRPDDWPQGKFQK